MIQIAIIEPVGGHGGMDFYDYGLAMGLGKNEVKVHYFTSTQTNERSFQNVNSYFYFKNVWDTKNKLIRLFYFFKAYWKSLRKSKELGNSIVHLHFFDLGLLNALIMILVNFFDFKKVLTLHDVSSFKGKNTGFTEQFILKSFDKFIVHNKLSQKELSKKLPEERLIKIIPHGNYLPFVDELNYEPENNQTLKLLFFGQIKKVKGLEILLEALAIAIKQNKKIHLTIAGKPWHDELSVYETLISDLKLENFVETHFQYVSNDKVSLYFDNCDLVILPYRKIYQSGILLLSMSYGRVALTSDLPAFKEIVQDGKTGFLFEESNPKDLARVILKIAGERKQLKEVNKQASILLKSDYNWCSIGAQTKQLYNHL